jgi:hypothetical protein
VGRRLGARCRSDPAERWHALAGVLWGWDRPASGAGHPSPGGRDGGGKTFAAYLHSVGAHEIAELRLGERAEAQLAEAERLQKQLDRGAYGPPRIRFGETDVDQARAAGVLIEFEQGWPIIVDRPLYRELVKGALKRTVDELTASAAAAAEKQRSPLRTQRPSRSQARVSRPRRGRAAGPVAPAAPQLLAAGAPGGQQSSPQSGSRPRRRRWLAWRRVAGGVKVVRASSSLPTARTTTNLSSARQDRGVRQSGREARDSGVSRPVMGAVWPGLPRRRMSSRPEADARLPPNVDGAGPGGVGSLSGAGYQTATYICSGVRGAETGFDAATVVGLPGGAGW